MRRESLLYEGPVLVRHAWRQASWSPCAILPRAGGEGGAVYCLEDMESA